jgi:biopolymer transport protein ExbB
MSRFLSVFKAVCFALVLQACVLSATAWAQPATTAAVNVPVLAENPYGLKAVWAQGDVVAKITLSILVLMSIFSWYLIVAKLLEQRRLLAQQREAIQRLGSQNSLDQVAQALQSNSPFRFIALEAINSAAKHQDMLGAIEFNDWLMLSLQRATTSVQQSMQNGLSFLATVGSTAPFVGLFGTVWGIFNALVSIGLSGQASIDKVAGPVGESLIMTAIGLAVAVPAVLGYNVLIRRNKLVMQGIQKFSGQVHANLLVAAAHH